MKRTTLIKAMVGTIALAWVMAPAARGADDFIPYGTDGLGLPPVQYRLNVNDRTIELLGEALRKSDGFNRVRLTYDLGKCDARSLKYLLPALGDHDAEIRAEAAKSIGTIGDRSALAALSPLLADSDLSVRREAIVAAARLGDEQAVLNAIDDPDQGIETVGITAANTAAQAEEIGRRLTSYSPRLKALGAQAIGRAGSAAKDALEELLKGDAGSRAAAVAAMGELKLTDEREQITAATTDVHPTVRRAALIALGNVATASERQAAGIKALKDQDMTVRQAGALLLTQSPMPSELDAMRKELSIEYAPLHKQLLLAMAATGNAVESIGGELLDDANPRRREDGSYLLGALHSKLKLARHIALLDDPDFGVAGQAAKSMYLILPQADEAGPALERLLDRSWNHAEGADAGTAAWLAAGRIHYTAIIPRALKLLPVPNPMVPGPPEAWRGPAMWAIGMTAKPGNPALARLLAVRKDPEQSGEMVFETIKAMANSHDMAAVKVVENWEKDPDLNRDPQARWMAYDTWEKLTGKTAPYVMPAPFPRTPELSIMDLMKR